MAFLVHGRHAGIIHQTERVGAVRQPQVRRVLAQQQAVLGARGVQSVRLSDVLGRQIIDQDADVGLVTLQDKAGATLDDAGGIDARDQPLRRRLLIAGGAIDLARQEESGGRIGLQRAHDLVRWDEIILDGVADAHHLRAL